MPLLSEDAHLRSTNSPVSILVKRSLLTDNDVTFKVGMSYGEDTLWRFYIWLYGTSFIATSESLYYYRQVAGSAMHSKNHGKWLQSMQTMVEEYNKVLKRPSGIDRDKLASVKLRKQWAVQNVLFGALRATRAESDQVFDNLRAAREYPYPIQWSRLMGSRSLGSLKYNLFTLLFPIKPYYRLLQCLMCK